MLIFRDLCHNEPHASYVVVVFVTFMNLGNNYRESIIPIYNDPYAVSVMKRREVVGHMPHKISRMCAINFYNWLIHQMH